MKNLNSFNWDLNIYITRDKTKWIIWTNQIIYIKHAVKLLNMSDYSSVKTLMNYKCELKKNAI